MGTRGRAGLILAGVAVAVLAGCGDGGEVSGTAVAAGSPIYSMDAVTDACALVDPAPLAKWSSTPKGAPEHEETRPSAYDAGGLKCEIGYTNSTTDRFPMNRARMIVEAKFTNGSAPPFYDHWKHADTATPGPGEESGEIRGLGTQAHWHSEITGDLVKEMSHAVTVQDGNVSVRAKVGLTREKGSPVVSRDELDSVARAQVRRVLGALRTDGESAAAPTSSVAPTPSKVPAPAVPTTTAARREAAPGIYSIDGIANACDLVDPTPLQRWSATPKEAPQHQEHPPSTADGGTLYCAIRYISPSTLPDDATVDEAGISLEATITGATTAPAYDTWKQTDTASTGPGRASGDVTGLGAQAFWHMSATPTGNGMTYIVGAQDGNASVRVEVAVLRAQGEAPVNRDDLAPIAESRARAALDGLKRK
ncbi:hypothetical protein BJY24_006835 [Nocardia transvalensis]|uniref:DUF3558 domain-containing protein n=1 Tax=Nocardia transvalensis TaxID=37333 RepID=A0A7W9PLL9_9NOCA|nr:hypothetical protein [Nocardia transvalensis]MBB5917923.1 hypothetical protein [Nocardia transvalensis]